MPAYGFGGVVHRSFEGGIADRQVERGLQCVAADSGVGVREPGLHEAGVPADDRGNDGEPAAVRPARVQLVERRSQSIRPASVLDLVPRPRGERARPGRERERIEVGVKGIDGCTVVTRIAGHASHCGAAEPPTHKGFRDHTADSHAVLHTLPREDHQPFMRAENT
nr:hypothetical protein OG781_27150 [Streptomyces sp. NBC_00830]